MIAQYLFTPPIPTTTEYKETNILSGGTIITPSTNVEISLFNLLSRLANGYAVNALIRTTKTTTQTVIIAVRRRDSKIPASIIATRKLSKVSLPGNLQYELKSETGLKDIVVKI
jgi:hypothetical protein